MAKIQEPAFFTAEEKVQLLSGGCPRSVTKDRLNQWLSYGKGSSKVEVRAQDSIRKSSLKGHCNFIIILLLYYYIL